jgi:hypothetical protein
MWICDLLKFIEVDTHVTQTCGLGCVGINVCSFDQNYYGIRI